MTEKQSKVKFISEMIGDKYKNWKNTDTIFLTATTGSGKSHFILHDFLGWIIERNLALNGRQELKILYLVNRKILKQQLKQELKKFTTDFLDEYGISGKDYITITTYQSIEREIKGNKAFETINWMRTFYCVVCDECHYFYTDSNFNTETALSYFAIRETFDTKLQIYISATANKVKEDIEKYIKNYKMATCPNPEQFLCTNRNPITEYSLLGNYDNVIPCVVHDDSELIKIVSKNIKEKKEKWLKTRQGIAYIIAFC